MNFNTLQLFPRLFLVLLFSIALVACGSGGSSDSDTLQTQTLTFSDPSPASIAVSQMLANPASGSGAGAITYSSSNTAVATVNNSGAVTGITAGETCPDAHILRCPEFRGILFSVVITDQPVFTQRKIASFTLHNFVINISR